MSADALWMRWLDFSKLRDLFWLVAESGGQLRAKDLNKAGAEAGILVSERGEPFKPTTVYHYRRTLQRLGLLSVSGGRYQINATHPAVQCLLAQPRQSGPLTLTERRAFATLVILNNDCYKALLGAFVPDGLRPQSVDAFVRSASPVIATVERVNAQSGGSVIVLLRSLDGELKAAHSGETAIQAIMWGLLPWCTQELEFLDGVVTLREEHVLFPREIAQERPVRQVAETILSLVNFDGPWATVRIEDLILEAGKRWRFPAKSTRDALSWLVQRFPRFVAPIPTSEDFALGRVHRTQRDVALNRYLRLPSGALVSHLRISSEIRDDFAAAE